MADVKSQPPGESPSDAQAAAAARKARRKKTRWGADVEPAQGNKEVAQAGSNAIPTVTSAPGPAVAANAPLQQELTGLKLNSSVPSGTPVDSQPFSASIPGPAATANISASSGDQSQAAVSSLPPWSTGVHSLQANGTAGAAQTPDNEVLPGPPPKAQPWMTHPAPAAHASGVNAMHPASHGAPYPAYGAEYYFQYPGGHAAPHLQPALTAAAEEDRPPGVDGEDAEEGPPGAEPTPAAAPASTPAAAVPPAGSLPGTPLSPSGAPAASVTPQADTQLPGPPAIHPYPATATPSFPTTSAPGSGPYPSPTPGVAPYQQPYPQPYPHPHYPYPVPGQASEAADAEPGPPGAEEEPQAPGTEGEGQAANPYGYPDGYTDPAYAYGSYIDPQTGYTYPYDPQQAYGYDQSYYGYAQYAQTAEGEAGGADKPPGAPAGEPGPPAGSPKKEGRAEADGKPSKPLPPVVQVKLPKQYYEKMQAKKREEEERRQQQIAQQAAQAEARRKAAADEAEAAAARRAQLAEANGNAAEQAPAFKDLDPEDQLLAASTPAEIRAAKRAIRAKEEAQRKAAAEADMAAAMPKLVGSFKAADARGPDLRDADMRAEPPVQHDRKRRTKSRWREEDDRDNDIDVKPSKRRRASPPLEPRPKPPPARSPSESPPPFIREPLIHRSPTRRRAAGRDAPLERPIKIRRPRGYRIRRTPSPSPARYTPQPPQEHEPQPLPKPQPTEEERAAAEAEAAVAAREATPEVSEEGEIPVDPDEMEELQSKSQQQQQPAGKPPSSHPHSPPCRHPADRGRDRAPDRDRAPPSRDRFAGGRGDRGERRRGARGRGNADFNRDPRGGFDPRGGRPPQNYIRPPPGLAPPGYGHMQQQQYEEYDNYDEGGAYEEDNIYAPQAYDAPYGVYGSAMGSAAGSGAYGQYSSYTT